jgi:hypothetical protein
MDVVATSCTAMLVAHCHFHSSGLPKLSKKDHKSVHKLLAIQLYMTCVLFVCIKKLHFMEVLQKLCPDENLPSRKDLAAKYLAK